MLLPTPAQIFGRIETAQNAWTRGGATVSVSNVSPGSTRRAQFRIDLDGMGGATLRVRTPAFKKVAATDQAFILKGARIVGYDLVANEKIVRPAPDQGGIAIRFAAVLGGLDDAVGFLVDRGTRQRYLAPFRALKGWKATPTGLLLRSKGGVTRLHVDSTGKLKALRIQLPDSRLDWSIAYGPYRPPALPKSPKPVTAFTERRLPPRYAESKARAAGERMLRAGARLTSGIVRLDDAATFWIGGSRLRYENGASGFAYDGRTLTVETSGATYRGVISRRRVIDVVATLLGDVDPFVRSVLVRASPFESILPPEAKVRIVGTMTATGGTCDVLAVEAPRFRASIFARKADGLPVSIESSALGVGGRAVSTTRRTFEWKGLGTPLNPALFALRLKPGARALPLPTATAP